MREYRKIILLLLIIVATMVLIFSMLYNHFTKYLIVDGILIKKEYEAKDPNTGKPIVYFETITSSLNENERTLKIKFYGFDMNIYYIALESVDKPDSWIVSRDRDFHELIPIKEVQHDDYNCIDIKKHENYVNK
jgi:hypothetical protein